jgi:Ankyrin repeats (3 copies)
MAAKKAQAAVREPEAQAAHALELAFDDDIFHCDSLRKVMATPGCDVNARSPSPPHRSLLHLAALNTCASCCPSLLIIQLVRRGCLVDARDDNGITPLMLCHLPQVARVLIELGADIHAACDYGCTALREAAGRGDFEVVKLLLARGADIMKADCELTTPLHLAIDSGHEDVALLLLEKQPSSMHVNAQSGGSCTPLYCESPGRCCRVELTQT